MKFDITQRMRAVDDYVATLSHPRHRAMIQNYRRHAILEVTGRWEEILAPRMTVAQPHYRIHDGAGVRVFDGMDKVRGFYRALVDEGSTVIYHTDEHVAVADWGFSTEYLCHRFWKGATLAKMGDRIDDPAATYLVSATQVMVWLFDDNALLKGERIYRGSDRVVRKCDPAEVITPQECMEKLTPLLPPLEECSLLGVC